MLRNISIIFFLLFSTYTYANTPEKNSKWEYKTVTITVFNSKQVSTSINRQIAKGWKYVECFEYGTGEIMCTFRKNTSES